MPFTPQDFQPAIVTFNIETGYGRTVTIRLKSMTWMRWLEIGAEVPDPAVPYTKKIVGSKQLAPNPYDTAYLKQLSKAQDERAYRRLVEALEGGGDFEFASKTISDKTQEIRQMDFAVCEGLMAALRKLAEKGVSEVQARAEMFQNEPVPDTEDASDEPWRLQDAG